MKERQKFFSSEIIHDDANAFNVLTLSAGHQKEHLTYKT